MAATTTKVYTLHAVAIAKAIIKEKKGERNIKVFSWDPPKEKRENHNLTILMLPGIESLHF